MPSPHQPRSEASMRPGLNARPRSRDTKTQVTGITDKPNVAFHSDGSLVEVLVFDDVRVGDAADSRSVTVSNTGGSTLTAPVITVATAGAPVGDAFSKGDEDVSGSDLAVGA